jgi:hypothetical protein
MIMPLFPAIVVGDPVPTQFVVVNVRAVEFVFENDHHPPCAWDEGRVRPEKDAFVSLKYIA